MNAAHTQKLPLGVFYKKAVLKYFTILHSRGVTKEPQMHFYYLDLLSIDQ